jgi:hypothetical protein
MRAGPLSRTDVSQLLNSHFVPVYVSNEDYHEGGSAPPDERALKTKIFAAGHKAKLSVGTVHAYVLSPDGDPVDSLHVADAARGDNLMQMLRRAVERHKVPAGETLVKPKAQSSPPRPGEGSAVLHLTARAEGTNPSDNAWHAYPSEDWIVLSASDQEKFLPPAGQAAPEMGATWEVDRAAATKVLTHFYPQTENNDVRKNEIERVALRGTVVSVSGNVARARLDGSLRMIHPFYHKKAEDVVDATVVGYVDFDLAPRQLKNLKLATERATYQNRRFDVGVETVR